MVIAMVENEDFQNFVQLLNPVYGLPSRKKLRDLIIEESDLVKEEV